MPGREPFRTVDLDITYLRPGLVEPGVTADVEWLHASRSIALAQVRIVDHEGTTACLARITLHRSATEA